MQYCFPSNITSCTIQAPSPNADNSEQTLAVQWTVMVIINTVLMDSLRPPFLETGMMKETS